MEVALAKAAATQLVSTVQMLQAAVEAVDQNNHECRMIVDEVAAKAPFIRDILKEARHFEDEDLNKSMALNLQLAVDAIWEATMAVYRWIAKPAYKRFGVAQTFQPALKNAKERLYARLNAITAHQIHRIDRRSEQMAQLAGRYDDISRIFEGLLSGTRLEATKKRTVAIARAQIEQASKHGQSLRGHTDMVLCICWSPDGTRVATASCNKKAAIWDATTGECLKVLEGHTVSYGEYGMWTELVNSICWSPDGTRVATASDDKTGAIWDAGTGERVKVLEGHTSFVRSICWSPDGTRVETASNDTTGAIWDAATGERVRVLEGHIKGVNSICWSLDGSRVATATDDMTGAIRDAGTGERLWVLGGHTGSVRSICWSPDGSRVATASLDKTGAIWDARTGERVRVLGHTNWVLSICWSPDGTRVATSSHDKKSDIWNAAKGGLVRKLEGHTDRVESICWSPDGTRVATASYDKTARIWAVRAPAD